MMCLLYWRLKDWTDRSGWWWSVSLQTDGEELVLPLGHHTWVRRAEVIALLTCAKLESLLFRNNCSIAIWGPIHERPSHTRCRKPFAMDIAAAIRLIHEASSKFFGRSARTIIFATSCICGVYITECGNANEISIIFVLKCATWLH